MSDPYDRLHEKWAACEAFDPSTVQLLLDLYRTFSAVDNRVTRALAPFDLSVSAFNILMLLTVHPDGVAPHQLSDLLVVSRTNVTRLVQSLVEKGLVARSEDPRDRRARILRITARGRRLAERLLPTHLEAMRALAAAVPEKHRERLSGLLRELRESAAAEEDA